MADFGVIGGVCTAHAPQLWTLPESEDPAVVGRLKALLGSVGDKLKAMSPDICVVIANDHAKQFLLHCTTSFVIHIGKSADGSFAGRDYSYPVAGDTALALIRHAQRNNFDPGFTSNAEIDYAFGIPLDFTGIESVPVVPVFVNAYVPPQPSMERCFAFGRVLGDGIAALGLRAVVVCSGGLSHFPGTERYKDPGPDTAFDRHFMAMMERGELRYLLALGRPQARCDRQHRAALLGRRRRDDRRPGTRSHQFRAYVAPQLWNRCLDDRTASGKLFTALSADPPRARPVGRKPCTG